MELKEDGMLETLNDPEENKYEEEWEVITSAKGKYTLSKSQANYLKQVISTGDRGIVVFQTFSISLPYIVEFYRVKRFLKEAKKLPATATEPIYKPIDPEKWQKMKRELYQKLGKKMQ